jgi:hypothetical protein
MVNKFTNIKERVVQIAKKQPISQAKFYHSIGMTSGSFRGKALNTPLNSNAIVNIITNYPEVDLRWLLMGEEKSPLEVTITDPRDPYGEVPKTCEEKDEIIVMLKDQVEELKKDKEDLRAMLKLANEKE